MFFTSELKKLLQDRIKNYSNIVDNLPLDAAKKSQLHVDFINFIKIVENLADRHLLKNDVTNVLVIILSAVVPVLINITPKVVAGEIDTSLLNLATWLSVLLAILNGLRQSYKFRERWQNYRQTAEQLILEGQSYFALNGKYERFNNHNDAFKKFIGTINLLRTQQINDYVNRLMAVTDKEVTQSIKDEVTARISAINTAKEKIELSKLINQELNTYAKSEEDIAYFEIDHDRKLVTIFITNKDFKAPDKFPFKDPRLGTEIYRIQLDFAEPVVQGNLGISTGVKNKDMPNRGFGAAGCILKRTDGKLVFITCYHVVKHTSQEWDLFQSGLGHDDVIDTENIVLGQIIDGEKSDSLDTALVAIDANIRYDDLLPGQVVIAPPVFIDETNLADYKDVYIISRTRNYRQIKGKLAEVNKHVTLNYGTKLRTDKKDLSGLMIVHYVSTEKFSLEGDSGSLVFTPDGTPVGLIVGGDLSRASFVIPFSTINDHYNFNFN